MDLDEMNDTELVTLAQEVDEHAHKGLGRPALMQIIEAGETEEELRPRKVNKFRLKIMGFILDNWDQVEPLLSCPARTKSPRACYQCTDVQVVECTVLNQKTILKNKDNA
jgi:hypothetical protein